MPVMPLEGWFQEHCISDTFWIVKRLASNDTLASKAHQAGPYLPKKVIFEAIPELDRPNTVNPQHMLDACIDSHAIRHPVRAVWYNSKERGEGTRNEARITRWGGSASPLLDPDSTGKLAAFVFRPHRESLHVWLCEHPTEEDLIEERIGTELSAGKIVRWIPGTQARDVDGEQPCEFGPEAVPDAWRDCFPTAEALVTRSVALRPLLGCMADERLLARRRCEFGLFQSLEAHLVTPAVQRGFQTLEAFTGLAQTVLQRRKSRAGLSLEYQTRAILVEEGFVEGRSMSFKPRIENGKEPDLLFPSAAHYTDPSFPPERLRMLALKTTLRDRWRQILNEASRLPNKHVLTLQDSLTETQYREIREANVTLVVPDALREGYPDSAQEGIVSLQDFIASLRLLNPELN